MTNNPVTFGFQIELEFVFEERKKPRTRENLLITQPTCDNVGPFLERPDNLSVP